MNMASKASTFRERLSSAVDTARRLVLLLLLLGGGVLVVLLAWTNMNLVTFLLFGALVGWVGYNEWTHYQLEDAVRIAEKRLWALEVEAGLSEAWLEELKAARTAQRIMGGMVSENVHWPHDKASEAKWRELEEAVEDGDDERADRLMAEVEKSEKEE